MTGINRQPPGISDLLNVQSGGRNPDDFSQIIRGVLDMYPFYQVDRLRAAIEPFSLGVGQREFIEVPATEVWLVEFLSLEIDSASGSTNEYQFSFGLERIIDQGPNGVELINTGLILATSATVASILVFGGQLPRPIMVTGGQRLTLLCCDENQPGDVTGNFNVVYTLMNV